MIHELRKGSLSRVETSGFARHGNKAQKTRRACGGLEGARSGQRGDAGFDADGDAADEIIEAFEDPAVAVCLRNRHQLIESLADTDGLEAAQMDLLD